MSLDFTKSLMKFLVGELYFSSCIVESNHLLFLELGIAALMHYFM